MSNDNIFDLTSFEKGDWVWCLHCERCYQAGEHREGKGGLFYCFYPDCDGDAVFDAWEWSNIQADSDYAEIPERGKVYSQYG